MAAGPRPAGDTARQGRARGRTAIAYCAKTFAQTCQIVTGTAPITCPPVTAGELDTRRLEAGFLFIKLHGLPDQPYWYGDHWITALSALDIVQVDLSHTVVFVANCFFPESPMLPALRAAGPRLIIGGGGVNWARAGQLAGPDYLALAIRRLLALGVPGRAAFAIARMKLRLHRSQDLTIVDALQFEML